MLFPLGRRPETRDVVDLLAACHARIRRFLDIAARIARERATADEVRAAADDVRRYFEVAFTLHVTDEDEVIAPALASAGADVTRALADMQHDHAAHAAAVAALIAACAHATREPDQPEAWASALAAAERELSTRLAPHLELEERVVFPALAALPAGTRDAIAHAMRERRHSDSR